MENKRAKTILLLEDDPEEVRLIRKMIDESSANVFEIVHVESISYAETYLAGHSVDIVLQDIGLVGARGLDAVRRVRTAASRVPIVLLSSADDEAVAVQAIHEDAQDYLIKGQIEAHELMRVLLNSAERKMIEEVLFLEKERAQVTLDCIGDAVICTDTSGNITFLNPVAENMTAGRSRTQRDGPFPIVDAVTREPILDPMAKAASQNKAGELPSNCVLICRDGHEIFIEDSVAPIRDREGQVTGAVIVFRDVTATRTLEEKLTHSAEHDFLTGLPNRMLLNDRVGQAIALARRQKGMAAVVFLDLDSFKQINDSLGHLIGDKLLRSVAKRLLDCVRGPDTVSRLGGDEFVVLLQELETPEDAATSAGRLLKAVTEVHLIDQHEIYVTTSIGVSIYPSYAEDAETLIKNADTAMYHAKKNGRQSFEFFRPEMIVETMASQSIEPDLLHASGRNAFTPHRSSESA